MNDVALIAANSSSWTVPSLLLWNQNTSSVKAIFHDAQEERQALALKQMDRRQDGVAIDNKIIVQKIMTDFTGI